MANDSAGALRALHRLLRPHRSLVALAILSGGIGGLAIAALLSAVNRALNAEGGPGLGLLLAMGGLCLVGLLGELASEIATNTVGQRLIATLREELARKILAAPIAALERYRTHRLVPVLNGDVDVISSFAFVLAPLAIALTICFGCLAYLLILSPPLFLAASAALALSAWGQFMARRRGVAGFFAARDAEDELQKAYRAIGEGAKELRLHRPRRSRLFTQRILATIGDIRDTQIRAINTYVTARILGSALFFLTIGLILALGGGFAGQGVLSGFVLVLLYMKGPVEQILSILPAVGRAQVAFRRIAALSEEFASPEPNVALDAPGSPAMPFRELALSGVSYAFPAVAEAPPFRLGPLDMTVYAGEILFIVGDNGSGKTTLIKLLLGLYEPQSGQVLRDGRAVDPAGRDDYRQTFATVFADDFLFDDLAEPRPGLAEEAAPLLKRLEIAHKVGIVDGAFTTTDLSTGQRKRLALVQVMLDSRPVAVFDEWAADQDPAFRRAFYEEILPAMRAAGRTIVAISHDDRYFHVADRILRLAEGRILAEERPAGPRPEPAILARPHGS